MNPLRRCFRDTTTYISTSANMESVYERVLRRVSSRFRRGVYDDVKCLLRSSFDFYLTIRLQRALR